MSTIARDRITGEVKMVSFSTTQKDGRTLLFPQMIDITNVKNNREILDLIMEFEANFNPAKETRDEEKQRLAAEKSYRDNIWNI